MLRFGFFVMELLKVYIDGCLNVIFKVEKWKNLFLYFFMNIKNSIKYRYVDVFIF